MNPNGKRDRARIYAEILGLISRQASAGETPTVTGIQIKVNVPFVRFKEYLADLREKGLISIEPGIAITNAGLKYLEEYARVREFLEKFGFLRNENS